MDEQHRNERGAVVVFVAVLILPLTLLLAFAIDTGNWWVHHRHLQTQADAGVLAGAQGPWFPACDETGIETAARQYGSNLGSGYNPQYTNSSNVRVLLNSTDYWEKGGSDFSDGGTPCQTLANATETKPGFLDLKVTESNLANFFGAVPGFSTVPAIDTHARVEIQALQQETGVRPLAVRDDSAYLCAQAQLWTANSDGSQGALLTTISLPTRTILADGSTRFQNPAGSPPIPLAQNISVRILLGNSGCATTDAYADPSGGVNFINVFTAGLPPLVGLPPNLHSVSIPPVLSNCTPDPYFSTNACDAVVKAYVDFYPIGRQTSGATQNAFVWVNGIPAAADTDSGGLYWTADVPIAAQSGPHPMTITWEQQYGTVGGKTCKKSGNPSVCMGSFNVQQQAFSATSDDSVTNSGSISRVQIGQLGSSLFGANSFAVGSTPSLVITVDVSGLANSKPKDPPIVIRYNVQGSKRTGVVDCGQGTGNQSGAILTGCPRPIYLWQSGNCGPPPPNAAPDTSAAGTPIDCVGIVPGNKRGQIKQAFATRIGNSCDNWNAWNASNGTIKNFPPVGDPRVIEMIITSPADLSGNGGSTADIPVLDLAAFYVTGGDGLPTPAGGPSCDNEPYPGSGSSNGAIWGHFIKFVPLGGIGNGKGCNPNQFGDCVAVLTQ